MARTVATIQAQITAQYVTAMAAIGVTIDPTKWSKRNIQQLLINIAAVCVNQYEQIDDLYIAQNETIVANAPAANKAWLRAQMFLFQYDATTPQVIQLNTTTFNYYYPIIDPTKLVVSQCSILTGTIRGTVKIKLATGATPAALSSPQITAAQTYITTIGDAGIQYIVSSVSSDKIMVQADVYYNSQYSSVISANVIAAINAFLFNQSVNYFDAAIKLLDLETAIRAVTGVNDVVLSNVAARPDGIAYGSGTNLVLAYDILLRQWLPVAGYTISETTSGHTLADTLNFIAQ